MFRSLELEGIAAQWLIAGRSYAGLRVRSQRLQLSTCQCSDPHTVNVGATDTILYAGVGGSALADVRYSGPVCGPCAMIADCGPYPYLPTKLESTTLTSSPRIRG